MTRKSFFLFVLVFAGLMVGLASMPAAADGNQTATNNTTTEDILRDRLDEKNDRIDDLEAKVVKLQSQKAKMENTIQTLKSDEGPDQWPSWMVNQMQDIGAWNPDTDKPAWYIVRNERVLYWVGPGNGDHSPTGMNAWSTWMTFEEAGTKNVTLPYAHSGVKKELNIKIGFESTGALTKIRQRVREANSPKTWKQAMEYMNSEYQSTKSVRGGTYAFFGGGLFLAMFIGMVVNRGKNGWLDGKIQSYHEARDVARSSGESTVEVLKRWFRR